jgi:GNAT superfamily N-acetyltransferase
MIALRQAEASDADVIAELHAASWRRNYRGMLADAYLDGDLVAERLAHWQRRLTTAGDGVFGVLALDDGRPVGFACAIAGADSRWGVLLDNVHVVSGEQRRGVGKRLVHGVTVWAREHHPGDGMYVWVIEANAPATVFYERLGATVVERAVVAAPGGGSMAHCRFVWSDIDALHRATAPLTGLAQ